MLTTSALLTPENYTKGLLVDDELLGGVADDPDRPGHYLAYVISVGSGAYLGCESYPELAKALEAINAVQRPWIFEKAGGCGGGTGDLPCGQGSCTACS